jgi:hypothetical protein
MGSAQRYCWAESVFMAQPGLGVSVEQALEMAEAWMNQENQA